jgi:hypothetical protein
MCEHHGVRHGIVEGEPGIFPAPIARFFQAIGRLFGRKPSSRSGGASRPPEGTGGGSATDSADLSSLDPVRPRAEPTDDDTPAP